MASADEPMKEPGGANPPDDELARLRYAEAAELVNSGRYDAAREALTILREAEPLVRSADDALKGSWHGQTALALNRLAAVEGNADYDDRAVTEFAAAVRHYERAGHERYCAANLHNLSKTLYRLGRHDEAHQNLDRARATYARLGDAWNVARVDGTRARVLVAEKRYGEASRAAEDAIETFEEGGEAAPLADALTVQGVARAGLCDFDDSIRVLRRAVEVAREADAPAKGGRAALTLIEEHGAARRLPEWELAELYGLADELLKETQDSEDISRLRACARVVINRLSGGDLHDGNFSLYGAVQEFEAGLIEQALERSGGGVTRAARLLGLKYQTLATLLNARHKGLLQKRRPVRRRRRGVVKKTE